MLGRSVLKRGGRCAERFCVEGEGTRLEFLREITMIIVMEEDSMTPQALAWDGGPWAARTEDKEGERGHANAA